MSRKLLTFYKSFGPVDELVRVLYTIPGGHVSVAKADQGPLAGTGMRAWDPLPWHASVKCDLGVTLPPTESLAEHWVFEVDEIIAWDQLRATDRTVKFTSLVSPRTDIDDTTFRARYAGHQTVASEHHGACVRYIQNVLLNPMQGPNGHTVHAVSELTFDSADEMVAGIYTYGPASIDAVRADTTGFIDFTRACSALSGE